jgi:PAS domain S-box-containing protein
VTLPISQRPSLAPMPVVMAAAASVGHQLPVQKMTVVHNNYNADDHSSMYAGSTTDRRTVKRAANRRSAQLSRKRKKMFVEELKEENDDLRRKELILKSIPDLIVVFDSSGKLLFVSHSVSRFLDFSAGELTGTSFWDRICGDSIRLLKAAFMDALAARLPESDTAPLGSGEWELRLVDKDGTQTIVALNGVVHFAGERPECVCSMRPREERSEIMDGDGKSTAEVTNSSSSGNKRSHQPSFYRVKPQQSVVSRDGSHSHHCNAKKQQQQRPVFGKVRESVRISDSCHSIGSGSSESGSSDELDNRGSA